MVHLTKLPANMTILRIDVPDTLMVEQVNWAPARAARQIGDEWLESASSPALRVPSVLVPRQWNFLLNPSHPLSGAR